MICRSTKTSSGEFNLSNIELENYLTKAVAAWRRPEKCYAHEHEGSLNKNDKIGVYKLILPLTRAKSSSEIATTNSEILFSIFDPSLTHITLSAGGRWVQLPSHSSTSVGALHLW